MQSEAKFDVRNITENYGEFVVEPLPRGYGVTLGNPLRRILLSSITGTAVTSVYIEDVLHEFSVIEGVTEDVMQIILNLKGLVVRLPDSEPATLTLRVDGPGEVKAGDFETPMGVQVINKDLHIATLSKSSKLVMEVRVEAGQGYVPAEVHGTKDRINSIPVDAIYTPVVRVAYRVEDTRVGQETDLDRLVLLLWTDGSVSPQAALDNAVEILRGQLMVFSGQSAVMPAPLEPQYIEESAVAVAPPVEEEVPEVEPSTPEIQITLEQLELSSRVLHSLQEEGIDSVDALLALSDKDLKKVGGVGDKSLEEIKQRLATHSLRLKEG